MNRRLSMPRLRTINNWLTVVVVALALYILAAPFMPQFTWWLRHESPVQSTFSRPDVSPPSSNPSHSEERIDRPDTLIIPRLGMNEPIHGGDISSLRKGVWRIPASSTPDKGSNTVLVGHRFTYSGQAVFYHLDKVKVGDELTLIWDKKVYTYAVSEISVVPPSQVSVEAPTKEAQLTLYTCTPLWNAKDRLVIQAQPKGDQP